MSTTAGKEQKKKIIDRFTQRRCATIKSWEKSTRSVKLENTIQEKLSNRQTVFQYFVRNGFHSTKLHIRV